MAAKTNVEREIEDIAHDPSDKVSIHIPRGSAHDEPNLFVSVNGINYLLPKGQTGEVPRFIADEIRRSQQAHDELDKHNVDMLGQ